MPFLTISEPNGLRVDVTGREATLWMYGDIGDTWEGIDAKSIAEAIAGLDVDVIRPRIFSRGGSILEGMAIHDALKAHPARILVQIDGAALSMAVPVAMAGDDISIAANAFMMIHRPQSISMGEEDTLRSDADMLTMMRESLASLMATRTGQPRDVIDDMMKPGRSTWMRGQEAVDKGFADRLIEPVRMAAGPMDLSTLDAPVWANQLNDAMAYVPQTEPLLKGANQMADTTNQDTGPKVATLDQLEQAFPDASAEFHLSQLKTGATLEKAAIAFATECQAVAKAEKTRADDAEAKAKEDAAAELKKAGLGVDPLGTGGNGDTGGTADPMAAYHDAIGKRMAAGMTRPEATRDIAINDRALNMAMIEEHNKRAGASV